MALWVLGLVAVCCWPMAAVAGNSRNALLGTRYRVDLGSGGVSISTNETVLGRSGDWITVSWENVDHPDPDDWMALFAPANASASPHDHAPIKYRFANESESHLCYGRGSLSFSIVNVRGDFSFAFLRGGLQNATVSARSAPLSFANVDEPLSPRWSFGPVAGSFRLSWSSGGAAGPLVQWGRRSGEYLQTTTAQTTTYDRGDMCGPPASTIGWFDPGAIHHAVLFDLPYSQKVFYRFGSFTGGFSQEYVFQSPPGPGKATRLLAYGDTGVGHVDQSSSGYFTEPMALATMSRIMSSPYRADAVLHIGDISYAQGFISQWDYFLQQIAPIASTMPYQVAIGNHERDCVNCGSFFEVDDCGGECGVPYSKLFPTPNDVPDQHWYSFDIGSVHVVVLSTEADFRRGSAQWSFLRSDLASVDRSRTPWVIVSGHRPMYIDSTYDSGDTSDIVVARLLRQHLEPMFHEHGVDLAIWGHNHSYQRTCHVLNETCFDGEGAKAPVHVVVGTAGFSLTANRNAISPKWLKTRRDEFGYLQISASKDYLDVEFIVDATGEIGDRIRINRHAIAVSSS